VPPSNQPLTLLIQSIGKLELRTVDFDLIELCFAY